jgi:hypothetical protein
MKRIILKIFQAKPSMYSSSVVLNVLGMQVFRIFFFYCRRVLRMPKGVPNEYRSYLHSLEQSGVAAVPNFLSPSDYEHVKREYDALSPQFKNDPSEIALPHVERMALNDKRVSPKTKELFFNSPMIKAMALGYLNRQFNLPLQIAYTRIHCSQEELNLPQNGGTNNVHFDGPLRIFKCFYYLSDTNENNAAFYYCLGSNRRFSSKRLWLEYKLSIRYALNKWNPDTEGEYRSNEPWVKITREEMKKYGLEETVTAVKGNTMVFADVGGFHRRGEFRIPGVRETVEINYRGVETLRNSFYPVEQRLKGLLKRKA